MKKQKHPRLPKTGEYVRMYGTLVATEDVTPPPLPTQTDYIFEDTSARVEGRINDRVIETYGEYNNFCGQDTCIEAAKEAAKETADDLGPCDMVFVVVKITARYRMRPTTKENFYAREFREFEADTYGSQRDLAENTEEDVWTYQCKAAKESTP